MRDRWELDLKCCRGAFAAHEACSGPFAGQGKRDNNVVRGRMKRGVVWIEWECCRLADLRDSEQAGATGRS